MARLRAIAAKVVAIRDLPNDEIEKWGAEFKRIFAVFQGIALRDGPSGQLALLADRHEAGGQLMRHRAAQDETPRLQPHDLVDAHPGIGGKQLIHAHAEPAGVCEKGGDIAEQDPLMREIDDGADIVFDGLFHRGPCDARAMASTTQSCATSGRTHARGRAAALDWTV